MSMYAEWYRDVLEENAETCRCGESYDPMFATDCGGHEDGEHMNDDQKKEADRIIERGKAHDIALDYRSFTVIDGEIYIDGMVPKEWLDAMTMD